MKKKLYLCSFCMIGILIANAQIKKGTVLLGGDVFFNSGTGSQNTGTGNVDTKNSSISLGPSVGKAIRDNLVLGISLNYGHTGQTGVVSSAQTTSSKSDAYGIGTFIRRYQYLGSGFCFFLQGGLNYYYSKNNTRSNDAPIYSSDGFSYAASLNIAPGVAYGLTKKLQLELALTGLGYMAYNYNKTDTYNSPGPAMGSKGGAFSIGSSLNRSVNNISIGCRFLL